MNLRRILLPANLILLGLLACVVHGVVVERNAAEPATAGTQSAGSASVTKRPVSPANRPPVPPKPETRDYALIVERNIFGSADAPAAEQPGEPVAAVAEVPPEPLHLKLIGTVAGDPDIARAVIQDTQSKTQHSYRIDDEVQGAVVSQILRNRVVLLRDGRNEILDVSLESPEPLPSVPVREAPSAYAQAGDLVDVVKLTATGTREIDRKLVAAKTAGIQAAFHATTFEPHVVDRQVAGVRVLGIADSPAAALAGLEDGDVITSINRQQLSSLPKAFQVMQKARKQQSIDVELLRGGEKKTLVFGMR